MTESGARIILDSLHPDGLSRVTTAEIVFWRPVLAEFNTHRWSRNSASSRAIPIRKRVAEARDHPTLPVSWPLEKPGMQGGTELEGVDLERVRELWTELGTITASFVEEMAALGLHKSVASRPLEWLVSQTVVLTGDDRYYRNFFALRCNRLAQPELRVAAQALERAYHASTPTVVSYDGWHLPLVTGIDEEEIVDDCLEIGLAPSDVLPKVSAARCARVSYKTHDGRRDWSEDLRLYEKLAAPPDEDSPPHASPWEHPSRPARPTETFVNADGYCGNLFPGNLLGWHQLRHEVEIDLGKPSWAPATPSPTRLDGPLVVPASSRRGQTR